MYKCRPKHLQKSSKVSNFMVLLTIYALKEFVKKTESTLRT